MKYTPTQKVASKLIVEDLRFVYSTLVANKNPTEPYYTVALQPYLGLVADGVEQWSKKVGKKDIPVFSAKEKDYYTELRNNIKLWKKSFFKLNLKLEKFYHLSNDYYASVCQPIAREKNLYDIYGCYTIKGYFCDNTILDSIYTPYFKFDGIDKEYIQSMLSFFGKLTLKYGACKCPPLKVDTTMQFKTQDYCGILPSPTGHREYNESFLLFSIMCSINFLIFGVNQYVIDETPTKLRFAYVQYFYLVNLIKEINKALSCNFELDSRWYNTNMRDCLAHYGLGSVLKRSEVDETDEFGGLTNKLFQCEWKILEKNIFEQLFKLSEQLRAFLKINQQ